MNAGEPAGTLPCTGVDLDSESMDHLKCSVDKRGELH